jgi:hypothetical protein
VHADEQWTEAVQPVLGIRKAYKDMESSPADFVANTWHHRTKVVPSVFIQKLHRTINQLRPALATRHSSPSMFIYWHVFFLSANFIGYYPQCQTSL